MICKKLLDVVEYKNELRALFMGAWLICYIKGNTPDVS